MNKKAEPETRGSSRGRVAARSRRTSRGRARGRGNAHGPNRGGPNFVVNVIVNGATRGAHGATIRGRGSQESIIIPNTLRKTILSYLGFSKTSTCIEKKLEFMRIYGIKPIDLPMYFTMPQLSQQSDDSDEDTDENTDEFSDYSDRKSTRRTPVTQ